MNKFYGIGHSKLIGRIHICEHICGVLFRLMQMLYMNHKELGIIIHMLYIDQDAFLISSSANKLQQYTDKPMGINMYSSDLYDISGAPDISIGSFGNS